MPGPKGKRLHEAKVTNKVSRRNAAHRATQPGPPELQSLTWATHHGTMETCWALVLFLLLSEGKSRHSEDGVHSPGWSSPHSHQCPQPTKRHTALRDCHTRYVKSREA